MFAITITQGWPRDWWVGCLQPMRSGRRARENLRALLENARNDGGEKGAPHTRLATQRIWHSPEYLSSIELS
jgi:hypothetical protein